MANKLKKVRVTYTRTYVTESLSINPDHFTTHASIGRAVDDHLFDGQGGLDPETTKIVSWEVLD